MKLSEVIKDIEDGKKRVFENHNHRLWYNEKLNCIQHTLMEIGAPSLPLEGWREIKPTEHWRLGLTDWVNYSYKMESGEN